MRIAPFSALVAFGLLATACDDKPAPTTPLASPAPNTTAPAIQNLVKPVTDGINKAAGATAEQLEAAKNEVAKWEGEVAKLDGQIKEQQAKAEALVAQKNKAIADAEAAAEKEVAPIRQLLADTKKQIDALKALKIGRTPKYTPAQAGFDVGGILSKGSDKIAALEAQAAKYQTQIDGILAKAKDAGLPYTDQITAVTSKISTLTSALTSAKGMLTSAQSQLSSLQGATK